MLRRSVFWNKFKGKICLYRPLLGSFERFESIYILICMVGIYFRLPCNPYTFCNALIKVQLIKKNALNSRWSPPLITIFLLLLLLCVYVVSSSAERQMIYARRKPILMLIFQVCKFLPFYYFVQISISVISFLSIMRVQNA